MVAKPRAEDGDPVSPPAFLHAQNEALTPFPVVWVDHLPPCHPAGLLRGFWTRRATLRRQPLRHRLVPDLPMGDCARSEKVVSLPGELGCEKFGVSARGVELVSCFGAYISAALAGTLPLTRVARNGSAGYIVDAIAV